MVEVPGPPRQRLGVDRTRPSQELLSDNRRLANGFVRWPFPGSVRGTSPRGTTTFENAVVEKASPGGYAVLSSEAAVEGLAMESLTRIVSESLSRHGVQTLLDPRRLQWSPWFRCESSSSALPVPGKPGVFALAEEVAVFGDASEPRKRMLALFQISEADDLGMALWRLFRPGSPRGDRLSNGRCFARYTVIEDASQRGAAHKIFQDWMQCSAGAPPRESFDLCGADLPRARVADALARESFDPCGADALVRETKASTSLALEVEAQHRELEEVAFSLGPLASGF